MNSVMSLVKTNMMKSRHAKHTSAPRQVIWKVFRAVRTTFFIVLVGFHTGTSIIDIAHATSRTLSLSPQFEAGALRCLQYSNTWYGYRSPARSTLSSASSLISSQSYLVSAVLFSPVSLNEFFSAFRSELLIISTLLFTDTYSQCLKMK